MDNNTTKLKFSSDVWFCAFLISKNVPIHKYEVVDRGKVRCYFNLTEDQWKDYKLQFNNSDIIKFKAFIDQLKDLAY